MSLQNFDSPSTDVTVKIEGIDDVPEEMKLMADIYITNAALFIHGVINGQVCWHDLFEEQAKIGRVLKDFRDIKLADTWVSAEDIINELLRNLRYEIDEEEE